MREWTCVGMREWRSGKGGNRRIKGNPVSCGSFAQSANGRIGATAAVYTAVILFELAMNASKDLKKPHSSSISSTQKPHLRIDGPRGEARVVFHKDINSLAVDRVARSFQIPATRTTFQSSVGNGRDTS
ncbi:uncharacterized protein [Euphorbia lathyris]|uniref:uncharacterized protein isoform X1 n=1 Tax=Euphorbia lathyris TaxID=212925 RepID=UPI003314127C